MQGTISQVELLIWCMTATPVLKLIGVLQDGSFFIAAIQEARALVFQAMSPGLIINSFRAFVDNGTEQISWGSVVKLARCVVDFFERDPVLESDG
jgi:hypothetical protein